MPIPIPKSLLVLICGITLLCLPLCATAAEKVEKNTNQALLDTHPQQLLENPLMEKAHIVKLPNGLTVYILQDDRFPLVSTRLYVRAGSAYESLPDAGISHVLEHMVFKGTDKRPKGAVARDIEAVGGYLNAATSFDYTVYLTDVPSAHWALGMDVVKDMAFHATLDAAELESEKKVVLAELQRGKDSPHSRIFEELQKASLQGTPYAHPIIGFEDTIKAVTPQSMRDYIAKYYEPQNMLLVVVGDIQIKDVLAEAQKLFGDMKNTADISPVRPINAQDLHTSTVYVEQGAWNKVYLGMALPVPGDQDVRSIPLDILSYVLGGDATSYLYKKYKYEKALVDSIAVGNYTFERIGLLYFTVQLDADKVEDFWKEFTADITHLKADVFSAEDIARAKLQIEDSVHRTKETLSGLASWKGRLQLFLGGEQGEKNMLTTLNAVTQEDLQQTIDQWLVPQRLSVALLAPEKAQLPNIEEALRKIQPARHIQDSDSSGLATGEVKKIDLGHGRTVVLISDTTMPYTSIDFYMTGGDSLLSPDHQGLAALTARVLTSGTKDMTAPELEKYLADRAASLSAVAGRQTFGISMREPTRFNTDLFALFTKILTEPVFREEEVTREKSDQIAIIRTRNDKALGLVFTEMYPFLFPGGHSYGFKSLGTVEKVESYTQSDIQSFWKSQSTQPWVLAVSGDFDAEAVLAFARNLPVPQSKSEKLANPTWGTEKNLPLHLPERDQAHLILAFKTVPLGHVDAAGLELLQAAITGQSGLLFRELRDNQGLGYTVTAQNSMYTNAGYMFFYIGTEPQKMEQAQKGFEEIISSLHTVPLPEAEVQSAKNQLEGDYYRARQSLSSRSSEAAVTSILGQELDFRQKRLAESKTKNANDLMELAKKYLTVDEAYVITVMP